MRKILLVFQYEFTEKVLRVGFIAMLILLPVISFIGFTAIAAFQPGEQENNPIEQVYNQLLKPEPTETPYEGYVDHSGLLKKIPSWIEPDSLLPYASEIEANKALESEEIDTFYVIPADYLKTGTIIAVEAAKEDVNLIEKPRRITEIMRYNLLDGDEKLTHRLGSILTVIEQRYLIEKPEKNFIDDFATVLPRMGIVMVFYTFLWSSASIMLNTMEKENKNRILEILFTSATPTEILAGKSIAIGIAGLLQTVSWAGIELFLFWLTGNTFGFSDAMQIPSGILPNLILFFFLSYMFYAAVFAGVGALMSGMREVSLLFILILAPLAAPILFFVNFIQAPNGLLPVILSLIPPTAPTAMVMRLVLSENVPGWQIALSALLLLLGSVWLVRLSARAFHTQRLLVGQGFEWKTVFKTLAGRA